MVENDLGDIIKNDEKILIDEYKDYKKQLLKLAVHHKYSYWTIRDKKKSNFPYETPWDVIDELLFPQREDNIEGNLSQLLLEHACEYPYSQELSPNAENFRDYQFLIFLEDTIIYRKYFQDIAKSSGTIPGTKHVLFQFGNIEENNNFVIWKSPKYKTKNDYIRCRFSVSRNISEPVTLDYKIVKIDGNCKEIECYSIGKINAQYSYDYDSNGGAINVLKHLIALMSIHES